MQSLRAFAEFLTAQKDGAGALRIWKKLTDIQEGPAGQIRAISETTEIPPAFAYAALARSARSSHPQEAAALYEKCQAQIERYADTPPIYRTIEEQRSGAVVYARRWELRDLYVAVGKELREVSAKEGANTKRETTLQKLDAMMQAARHRRKSKGSFGIIRC